MGPEGNSQKGSSEMSNHDGPNSTNYLFVKQGGSHGIINGQFEASVGIARDSQGYIYVVDIQTDRIQKFDSNGNSITKWDLAI